MSFMILIEIALFILMGLMGIIPSRPHANIILENTLPKDKLNAPVVKALIKDYRKGLLIITIIFSLTTIPLIFLPYDSILFTGFMLGIFGFLGTMYLYQVHYIHKLHDLQAKMGWLLQAQPILIDTQAIQLKNRKMLSIKWLLGSLLLTIVAAAISILQLNSFTMNLVMIVTAGILWLLSLAMYYYIRHFPVKAWSQKTELNQQYNDLTKFYWSLITVILSYMFVPLILLPYGLLTFNPTIVTVISVAYFLVLFIGCGSTIALLFKLRKKQDQLMAQTGEQRYSGDDQYWRYGVYYNPNDNRLMLPDRVGMNITTNMAKPAAKIGGGILVVFLVGILTFVMVPMFQYDFQTNSIRMEITQEDVVMTAPLVGKSSVPFNDIESVELITDLPKGLFRVNGMGTENYATGSFAGNGRSATLYVRLDQKEIIYLKTADRDYYFTASDAEETKKEYQQILQHIS
ncbi:PH domain-containing protein [Enterococcus sp. HY326]|uniref:PH domain-containing protein n=1 Tax=Enterococcus sp. HY326 TaxID=2971265 RepID=UPI00223EC233|nr:PH domain-containing protein [Enterococcus sp. HY326]